MESASERAARRNVEVEASLVVKKPAQALAELASERGARLIVVGTHSEKPLRAAIVGSTPTRLLAVSEVPVLVVPLPAR